MKRISNIFVVVGLVMLGLTSAETYAGREIVTRSVEDAHADLMRTYKAPGGPPAGIVHSRSAEDAKADMMRDWSAKPSNSPGVAVHARSIDEDYIDLMRMWTGHLPDRN
ncbi:MAG: hypothetical protein HY067_11080 [Betaproteobacteria bacterium]|nr:hypothetical protein [Betaproteobacteria bacterium]